MYCNTLKVTRAINRGCEDFSQGQRPVQEYLLASLLERGNRLPHLYSRDSSTLKTPSLRNKQKAEN